MAIQQIVDLRRERCSIALRGVPLAGDPATHLPVCEGHKGHVIRSCLVKRAAEETPDNRAIHGWSNRSSGVNVSISQVVVRIRGLGPGEIYVEYGNVHRQRR